MTNSKTPPTPRRLRETLIREMSTPGFKLLVEQALPVYLISDEYAGLPFEDRLKIMNAISGLHDMQKEMDLLISEEPNA